MNAKRYSPLAVAIAFAAIAIAAQIANAKGDPLADLAMLLERQPNLATNAYILPNAALLPEMAALRKSIDTPEIGMAIEEYALATVLAGQGYNAMLVAKAKLGISRETKIESVCVKTCNHGGANQDGFNRCGKCGGSGRCSGRCSLRKQFGTGNGLYKRYLVPSAGQMKGGYVGDHSCAADRGIARDEAVSRYNGGCGGRLHRDGNGFFFVEICPDCKGSAHCDTCGGSGKRKSKVDSSVCARCKGTGKLADRAAAGRMLVFFDKWLRGKTAGYALGAKVVQAVVSIGGSSLKCDGVAVSHDGKLYVAAPIAVMVANSGLRIGNDKGTSLPLGDISVATREGVAFIEVLGKVEPISLAESAFTPQSGGEAWLVIRNPTNASPSVAKCEPAGTTGAASAKIAIPEGDSIAGTPIVKSGGELAGLLAEDMPRTIGDKNRRIKANSGAILPVGTIVLAGAKKIDMDAFRRETTQLVEGETQFVNASNLVSRAEEAFAAGKPYSLTVDFSERLETLTTSLSETQWSIPDMAEFASKITSQARMLIVRQKLLKSEYDALEAKKAEAEREAAKEEEARRASKAPKKSGFRPWMILLVVAAVLLVSGLGFLINSSGNRREQP